MCLDRYCSSELLSQRIHVSIHGLRRRPVPKLGLLLLLTIREFSLPLVSSASRGVNGERRFYNHCGQRVARPPKLTSISVGVGKRESHGNLESGRGSEKSKSVSFPEDPASLIFWVPGRPSGPEGHFGPFGPLWALRARRSFLELQGNEAGSSGKRDRLLRVVLRPLWLLGRGFATTAASGPSCTSEAQFAAQRDEFFKKEAEARALWLKETTPRERQREDEGR